MTQNLHFARFVLPFVFLLLLKTNNALKKPAQLFFANKFMSFGALKMSQFKNYTIFKTHSIGSVPLPSNPNKAQPL